MKLKDFLTEEQKKGTYAAVHFDTETKKIIEKYLKDNNIPNPVPTSKLHTTVLYSRKHLPNYKPAGKLEDSLSGKVVGFEVWPSRPPKDSDKKPTRCLVIRYDSPQLTARHEKLMKDHDATYDFPDYKPHITISYDIGDINEKKLPDIKKYLKEVTIVEEYGEDLDLDWASNNTPKKD